MRCKKTNHDIDMGCGGFSNLRNTVAKLASPEFAEHYEHLTDAYHYSGKERDAFFEDFDKKTMEMLNAGVINIKILDFLMQSDSGGAIHYGACKNILKTIGDYDDNICYGYAGQKDCAMFRDFKQILQDCVDTKSDMVWN